MDRCLNVLYGAPIPRTSWSAPSTVHRHVDKGEKDEARLWGGLWSAAVLHPCGLLHSMATTWGYPPPSGHEPLLCGRRTAGPWRQCQALGMCRRRARPGHAGGVTPVKRRKGRNRAKATRPRQRHGHPVQPCAWCAHPVHGDAVTVTFPDKAQVTFHVACLDQYRAVMWPWAAP